MRTVLALGHDAGKFGKQSAEVEVRIQRERKVDVKPFGEVYAADIVAERNAAARNQRAESEFERKIDVRFVEEVDEFDVVGNGLDIAVAVDHGVHSAEVHGEVEVFAHAEHYADGKSFGRVAARNLQTVVEFNGNACVETERFVGTAFVDFYALHTDEVEQRGKQPGAESHVNVEVAHGDVGRGDDGKKFRGNGDRASRACVAAARSVGGKRFVCAAGGGEEGFDVHLQGKAVKQFLGSCEIDDSVHEPHAQRRGTVRDFECEINVESGKHRADIDLLALRHGERRYQGGNVRYFRLQHESGAAAERLLELGKHRDEELVRLFVIDVGEPAFERADVDVRPQTYADGLYARKQSFGVECEVALFVEQVAERGKRYVIAVLPARGECRKPFVEIAFVYDGTELRFYADGKPRDNVARKHVSEVHIKFDVLGGGETVVAVFEHDVADNGNGRAFEVAREGKAPDVVEDFLRQGGGDCLDVEDVIRHIDVDIGENGSDQSDYVGDGFAAGGTAVDLQNGAVCDELTHRFDGFLLFVRHGGFVFSFLRVRGVGQQSHACKAVFHERNKLVLNEVGKHPVEVDFVDDEFARAENAREVDVQRVVRSHVTDARAHVIVDVLAGYLDEQIRARVVEHIYAARDVYVELVQRVFDVDFLVEDLLNVLGD